MDRGTRTRRNNADGTLAPTSAASRSEGTRARREAITSAALEEFSEKGFAATRIEDVATRAGVAKGTIYLHFRDKAALFEGIVRAVLVSPLEEARAEGPADGESVRAFLERVFVPLLADLGTSRRGDIVRLLISEGARFPDIARSYHSEVVTVGLDLIRSLAIRARANGEIDHDLMERFPQVVFAPALLGLLWAKLFEPYQTLDTAALLRAQLDLIFDATPASG